MKVIYFLEIASGILCLPLPLNIIMPHLPISHKRKKGKTSSFLYGISVCMAGRGSPHEKRGRRRRKELRFLFFLFPPPPPIFLEEEGRNNNNVFFFARQNFSSFSPPHSQAYDLIYFRFTLVIKNRIKTVNFKKYRILQY